MNLRDFAQTLTITVAAIFTSLLLFGLLILAFGMVGLCPVVSPLELYQLMFLGGFGTSFSWQNTLTKAAPLILTALCTALPARVGLVVIGGEGAVVLGGLAATMIGLLSAGLIDAVLPGASPLLIQLPMALAGMATGAMVIMLAGGLRYFRGVNETIASLLLNYIAILVFTFLVEGPLRNPASLNKPSTYSIPPAAMIGTIFGLDIHWNLIYGIVFCLAAYVLMYHTTFGFAAHMVGGNVRAAQSAGLPVGKILLITCALGGAAAGLAGMAEMAAHDGSANATLNANYGYMGILVAFIAHHHPLAIIPVAMLFGGLNAGNGLLQRRLHLPDASVQMLTGVLFVMILLFETLYGRLRLFQPKEVREALAK